MSLLQNQFKMATLAGTKDWGTQVMTVEFYDGTSTNVVAPGMFVKLAATTIPNVTKVQLGSAATDKYFGCVLTNPLKDSFGVGDKLEVAIGGSVVMCTASAAITAGDSLQYDYATGKVSTKSASNTVVGIALESAASANDLVRVLVQTNY